MTHAILEGAAAAGSKLVFADRHATRYPRF
jgi:hypothetical protein